MLQIKLLFTLALGLKIVPSIAMEVCHMDPPPLLDKAKTSSCMYHQRFAPKKSEPIAIPQRPREITEEFYVGKPPREVIRYLALWKMYGNV